MNKGYHKKLLVSSIPLSLFSHPAHSVQVRLFSDFWEQKRKCRIGAGRGGGVPQQQRKADCLALPAQTGRRLVATWSCAMCWHVLHPPPPWTLSLTWGDSESTQTGEERKKWHLVLASQLVSDFCRERPLATNTLKSYKPRHMHTHTTTSVWSYLYPLFTVEPNFCQCALYKTPNLLVLL